MQSFLNPQQVLAKLDLDEYMIAADFGSGSGGWVIPLAKILKKGKVFAIDILEEPLSALRSKIEIAKISNIELIRSDVETKMGSKLSDGAVDLVLMTNLLFEVEDRKGVLEEGKRVLREEGKILVVDWKPESPLGPAENRVSPEEVKKIAKELDFKLENEFEAGLYHYALLLRKL